MQVLFKPLTLVLCSSCTAAILIPQAHRGLFLLAAELLRTGGNSLHPLFYASEVVLLTESVSIGHLISSGEKIN